MTRYFTDRRDSWVIAIDSNSIVTGETFKAKDFIKSTLGGRWDADRKVWIANPAKVESATKSCTGLYNASEQQIATLAAVVTQPRQSNYKSGTYISADGVRVCNRCHTVCHGDCTAN